MRGVVPCRDIQDSACRLSGLRTRGEISDVPDRIERLFEVIPPGLQEPVEQLIAILRRKLQDV